MFLNEKKCLHNLNENWIRQCCVVYLHCRLTKIETMNVLNLNIGILGHVDSGKTSLAKVLSSTSSTACFDKNPQSQERGITIDLGFSSLLIDFPKTLDLHGTTSYDKLQYTFVDCPGHASLIRTIIGGKVNQIQK